MLGVIVCLVARAEVTVLVPVEVDELTRDASAIVRGQVRAVEAQWTDDRRAIRTVVTIDAEQSLKGSLGASVQFVVPGGRLGRYRSVFVGAPVFSAGQHVVVFLGWRGPSFPYLLGLGQGVFRVEADREGGWLVTPPQAAAVPSTAQIKIVSNGTLKVARGDLARRPIPLAEFEQRVRTILGTSR
jgi:hypothetical protein